MGILWFGGQIYTMEKEGSMVEAVFTVDDTIKAAGTYEKLYHTFYDDIDKEVNLQGRTMIPGLVDSHLHIVMHGEKLLRLDLSQMTSAEEVKEALQNRIPYLSDGEWLIGEGWNENQWDTPSIINREELDSIAPDNPMMLTRICRHALIANTKALEIASIDKNTADPQGGRIVRDENGEVTGYLLDNAQDLVKTSLPDVSQSYLEQVIKIAVDDLHSKGLVGGHTEDLNYYGYRKTLDAYHSALHKDRKFKAHLLVHHEVVDELIQDRLRYLDGTRYVEMGAVKIFSDGALGGRTAWLSEDYSDDPGNKGFAIHETQELEQIIKKARKHQLPVAVHAIGDKAVEEIAGLIKKYPLENGARDRIIHGVMLNESTLDLLKELPAVVDIQPSFMTSDFPWVIDRLGEKRLELSYAWKTMIENNIFCAGGSDAPIEEVDPLVGIEAAVTRKSTINDQVYHPEEKLSVYQAVRLYTAGSAYVVNQEDSRGVIVDGYRADFTVLGEDIFQTDAEKISDIPIEMTVVDGDIVYERNPSRA
ncbi:amidohydrolase [Virgibacillus xinjiangensis]|uniref:Amidohydrolase n=1 Tax=Virgibacillus xinjiangensis TaxID=393090 RepID=A0ABV7CUH3_9BACI